MSNVFLLVGVFARRSKLSFFGLIGARRTFNRSDTFYALLTSSEVLLVTVARNE